MSAARSLPNDWFPRPLPDNVSIGPRSYIDSAYSFLHHHSTQPLAVSIGHDTGLYVGTTFCTGPNAIIEIGNFCTLVCPLLCTRSRIVIGDHALISNQVILADTFAAAPSDATLQPETSRDIFIGENVWIGAHAIILGGARIGDNTVIGAAAVVDFDVPENAIVAGNPAKIIGWTTLRP